MTPIAATPDGVRLRLRIQPRASVTEIAGLHGNEIKLRVAAPPVDGAANDALVRFLAERLDVPRSAVQLVAGVSGRSKVVLVAGINADHAAARLNLRP